MSYFFIKKKRIEAQLSIRGIKRTVTGRMTIPYVSFRKEEIYHSVTIAPGKISHMILILDQLIKVGVIISRDGSEISRDKCIAEILHNAFGIETKNIRQLLHQLEGRRKRQYILEDLIGKDCTEAILMPK